MICLSLCHDGMIIAASENLSVDNDFLILEDRSYNLMAPFHECTLIPLALDTAICAVISTNYSGLCMVHTNSWSKFNLFYVDISPYIVIFLAFQIPKK